MNKSQGNRFQDFFVDDKYIILKNCLYNYLLRKYAIEKVLRNEKRDVILEVGSGISPIFTADERVVYSDLSFLALQTMKRNFGKGLYVVADIVNLPFRTECFSHVVSSEVLEHIEDDRRALLEIARVIKASGILIVTFPHRHFYFACDDRFVKHFRRYELAEMENRLKEAGLHAALVHKVLGPLEKITMCMAISVFSMIHRFHKSGGENARSTKKLVIFSSLFKWINKLYAGFAWFDASIMPRVLSTVLLIKAVKK